MARRSIGEENDMLGAAGPKDSESGYFSLREAVPPTGRAHSGSMDVLDVVQAPRLGSGMAGEALYEDRAEDDYPDDSSSDEGDALQLQPDPDEDREDDRKPDGQPSGVEGVLVPGVGGSGLGGAGGDIGVGGGGSGGGNEASLGGKTEDVEGLGGGLGGESLGGSGLELDIVAPSDGMSGSGNPGDGGKSKRISSPLGQGPNLQAIAMEAAESSRVSPSVIGGALDSRGVPSGVPLLKTWRHTGEMPRDRMNIGMGNIPNSAARERSPTAVSSSDDESMAGQARLSAPAMKKQWEEAMSGALTTATTPDTPLRKRRGSTSVDGGNGADLGSGPTGASGADEPSPPESTVGIVAVPSLEGAVNRVVRSSSVGGESQSVPAIAPTILGTHLRVYGWVADSDVSECMNACGRDFTPLERRHHCRCCGGIFCQDCSGHRSLVPEPLTPPGRDPLDPTTPHRVCNACFYDIQPYQEELLAKLSKAGTQNTFNANSPVRYCNPPFGVDLAHEVRKASNTLNNVLQQREQLCECDGMRLNDLSSAECQISRSLWKGAEGLVFITVAKAGFGYAAEAGTGLCVARLWDGSWSAPSAVGTFGLSWGFQAGCEVVDMVIPLRSPTAVKALMSGGQVYAELDAAVALGTLGRSVSSSVGGRVWPGENASVNVGARYSLCKGLFAGVGVGAGFLRVLDRVNERFYGAQVSPRDLLEGITPRPYAATPLYTSLAKVNHRRRRAVG